MKGILKISSRRISSTSSAGNVSIMQQKVPEHRPEYSNNFTSFYHKDLKIISAFPLQRRAKPSLEQLAFGHHFSDHMFEVDWSAEHGWATPLISKIHEFSLHPGIKAFHYAIQLFEGLKAYRAVDNKIRLFRMDKNLERMKRTAARSGLPDFEVEELKKIILDLILTDKEWVPYSQECSLYIRPTMIGTDPTLGISKSKMAKLFVVTGPVSIYFRNGYSPLSLLADSSFVRASPGGVGSFKMGCNYAPTIMVADFANSMGCEQVLWLYDDDEKLTEVGTMNIFIYWQNEDGKLEVITPPLTEGIILPGITRDSVLEILREWDEFIVTERYPTMAEVRKAIYENRVHQMFGTGTACVVCPIGRILHKIKGSDRFENLMIQRKNLDSRKNVMQRLYDTITGIQYGTIPCPDKWIEVIG